VNGQVDGSCSRGPEDGSVGEDQGDAHVRTDAGLGGAGEIPHAGVGLGVGNDIGEQPICNALAVGPLEWNTFPLRQAKRFGVPFKAR